ncbi:MAG: MFS transporter [Pirellulaceae bacterium]|nr:MFS transporter [Pirellulaceae bacterium]
MGTNAAQLKIMIQRFCLYGFLKNQRYFEPYFMLALLAHELSFFWIGMLYACRSISMNVLEIPSGVVADSWGRRGCMIFSFLAYIASFLLFGLATHWLWFFPAMVLYGIGDSFRTGTHKAMIFEWLRQQGREEEKTRIYGITRSWSKFGSAASAIFAAAFVLITGDYRKIFLFATLPYVLNIINFLGYPKSLDGAHGQLPARPIFSAVLKDAIASLKNTLKIRPLRRLTFESMAWEGVLQAVKDYLQPALAALFIFATWTTVSSQAPDDSAQQNPGVVIVIALVYTLMFLASGLASRTAHRWVARFGSEANAARRLWFWNFALYITLIGFDLWGSTAVVAAVLIALIVLQNVWRPILISRFDQYADPAKGATVLSIESQSQRFATFLVAPLVGWAIDHVATHGLPGSFWPIGLVGAIAAFAILISSSSDDARADQQAA